ncbi:MAG: hypothetical protein D3920_00910 [Candidatus Electrothrix sp. AW2]|nr:hypothetical protein [Candidatus Electrothrix gigas]
MENKQWIFEKCDCCQGTGLCTTFFVDDFSSCMNCNGTGFLKYYEPKKDDLTGDLNKRGQINENSNT